MSLFSNIGSSLVSKAKGSFKNSEVLGSLASKAKSALNTSKLKSVANSIAGNKSEENFLTGTMKGLATKSKDMLGQATAHIKEMKNSFVETAKSAFDNAIPFAKGVIGAAASTAVSAVTGVIKGVVSKAVSAINNAISKVKNFLSSINPLNGFGAIGALAKFLVCPEENLFGDLKNAFNSVMNDAKNLKPSSLLDTALASLTDHIRQKTPGTNNMMSFFNDLNRYFNTKDSDRVAALQKVSETLNKQGLDLSYFDNYNILNSMKDLLDPNNSIYTGYNTTGGLPQEEISNKCSELGRIMAQLEGSYRSNNRYDDLITDQSIIQHIQDPDLKRVVNNMLNVSSVAGYYYDNSKTAAGLGYNNKTAISNVMTTAMNNYSVLNQVKTELENVGDDYVAFESAKINAMTAADSLTNQNNVAMQRMMAFEKGIQNIERDNSYYDISGVLSR